MTRFLLNDPQMLIRRRALRSSQTDSERAMWQKLRGKQLDGMKFFRQYSVGSYILDYYCPLRKLAIEIDGSQHQEDEQMLYDERRTAFLEAQGITVIRFFSNDVLRNINGVLEEILRAASG